MLRTVRAAPTSPRCGRSARGPLSRPPRRRSRRLLPTFRQAASTSQREQEARITEGPAIQLVPTHGAAMGPHCSISPRRRIQRDRSRRELGRLRTDGPAPAHEFSSLSAFVSAVRSRGMKVRFQLFGFRRGHAMRRPECNASAVARTAASRRTRALVGIRGQGGVDIRTKRLVLRDLERGEPERLLVGRPEPDELRESLGLQLRDSQGPGPARDDRLGGLPPTTWGT